jgi:hypothetical protein
MAKFMPGLFEWRRSRAVVFVLPMLLLFCSQVTLGQTPTPTPDTRIFCTGSQCPCVGDCDRNDTVTIDELLTLVNVALGLSSVSTCPIGDDDGNHAISIDEILSAVKYAEQGCPDTPGFCSKCSCEFVGGHGVLTLRGAVPSCTGPCQEYCTRLDWCEGLVSAACVFSSPSPSTYIPQ